MIIYIFTNYLLNTEAITVTSSSMIKCSGFCFGIYISAIYIDTSEHNAEIIALFGTYWLPWGSFIVNLVNMVDPSNKIGTEFDRIKYVRT